jgi:hypothetical protein
MNIRAKAAVAIAAVCSMASSLQAAEGFLMVETTVAGPVTRTSRVQLEPGRMRTEMTGPAGEKQIIVFDGTQQVLRMISVDKKSYTEMTKADADRAGEQVGAALAAMNEKLAKMPPEQQAKLKEMLARQGGAARGAGATAKPEYRRAGTDKVGKWTCDKYEGFRNGEKVSELCTVDPKTLGLTPADFEVSKQVAAFFRAMLPQGEDQLVGIGTIETQGFAGVPVRRIRYNGGKVQATSEVTEARRDTFDAASYEVPAGFQKQALGRR